MSAANETGAATPHARGAADRTTYSQRMSDGVEIKIRPSGPYLVSGTVTLTGSDGQQFDLAGKDTIALCRCGGSTTKPFCDGTHSKIGFQAATKAVEETE